MEESAMHIGRDTFRSPLIPAALILYALAFLFGTVGVVLLFSPEYAAFLRADLLASGISDASSLRTWKVINTAITVLTCLGPAVMALGLFFANRGRIVRGLGILGGAAQVLYWVLTVAGGFALVVYIFKFTRYVAYCVTKPDGAMLLYSMIISEALMGAISVFLFVLARKFLDCCADSATSITYTLAVQKLDDKTIPGFTGTGFLLLGIVGAVLAVTRLFTLTIVWDSVQSYYKLLVASHPAQIADFVCLVTGAAANILIFSYLRRYKRLTEEALYRAKGLLK